MTGEGNYRRALGALRADEKREQGQLATIELLNGRVAMLEELDHANVQFRAVAEQVLGVNRKVDQDKDTIIEHLRAQIVALEQLVALQNSIIEPVLKLPAVNGGAAHV